MKRATLALASLVLLVNLTLSSSSVHGAVILQNAPTGGSISTFGVPDSQTYGQVFTAPISGTLTSFTLSLNSGVGALHGAVGQWNGTAAFGFGFGESNNLYTSSSVPSLTGGAYTFTPNISVVAGQQYVAYISVFGEGGATTTTSMPLGTSVPGIDYFVWNNTSDPKNNPSWNYFNNFGNALFSATFAPAVPEPSTFALFGSVIGLGLGGFLWNRRRRAVAAS